MLKVQTPSQNNTSLTPSHQIVCQFLVTRFCGCGSCSRKRGGGEEEPLLQSAADHGVVPCVDKRGSIQQYSGSHTRENKMQYISTSHYDLPQ